MANMFDLSGRAAIVTGANAGIGQAIAVALAGAGADVACVGRSAASDTVAQIEAMGRRAINIAADLSTIAPVGERPVSPRDLGSASVVAGVIGGVEYRDSNCEQGDLQYE